MIIALVGLAGSGKTEAARFLEKKGFSYIRLGQITIDTLKEQGLEVNEKNERVVREGLREGHGMDAYAKLNAEKIDCLLNEGNVVIDGLYSWEEYMFFKKKYGEKLKVVAIFTSPKTRYERLNKRGERPLTCEEVVSRDIAEITNSNKAGPIVIADETIINNSSIEDLHKKIDEFVGGQ